MLTNDVNYLALYKVMCCFKVVYGDVLFIDYWGITSASIKDMK